MYGVSTDTDASETDDDGYRVFVCGSGRDDPLKRERSTFMLEPRTLCVSLLLQASAQFRFFRRVFREDGIAGQAAVVVGMALTR